MFKVEPTVAELQSALQKHDERIARLDENVQTLSAKPKGFWDKLQILAPIIQGILIAFIGYVLTNRVSSA